MTRRMVMLMSMLLVLTLGFSVPVLADSKTVSADCGNGAYFFSRGTAYNNQKHKHDGSTHQWTYPDTETKSKNWGWETGWESAEVSSTNTLLSPTNAFCVQ